MSKRSLLYVDRFLKECCLLYVNMFKRMMSFVRYESLKDVFCTSYSYYFISPHTGVCESIQHPVTKDYLLEYIKRCGYRRPLVGPP